MMVDLQNLSSPSIMIRQVDRQQLEQQQVLQNQWWRKHMNLRQNILDQNMTLVRLRINMQDISMVLRSIVQNDKVGSMKLDEIIAPTSEYYEGPMDEDINIGEEWRNDTVTPTVEWR